MIPAQSIVNTSRQAAQNFLSRLVSICGVHAWILPTLLAVLASAAALAGSREKPLWHDELFTYYLAQAPTVRAMWSDLRVHDLNPPLVYLLTRASFRLFGVNTLATRLPEIFFFLVLLLATYRLVARRMGPLFGVFAAALLFMGKTFELSYEARPYTLLLGLLAVALAAWQQATERTAGGPRSRAIALLAVANILLLLSHIFAVPAILVLLLAELGRGRERRRMDLPVLAALLAPFLITVLYLPMLRNHAHAIYPESFQPTGDTIFEFYIAAIDRELIALLLTGLATLALLGVAHLRSQAQGWYFKPQEWVALVALLALPLLLMLDLMFTHGAFFQRYGAPATIAVVCLCAALLGRWTSFAGRLDARAALLGFVIVLLIAPHTFAAFDELVTGRVFLSPRASEPVLPVCGACVVAARARLPLVAAAGITFLEINHHERPEVAANTFYLTDADASTSYSHANIFEQMPQLVDRFRLSGHSLNYYAFVAAHPHFYVIGRYDWPEDWLLRKLIDDGATLKVVGRTADEYRDKELYEVTTRLR